MVLEDLESAARNAPSGPPVTSWNPSYLGEIDMRIASDGVWYYMGTPIERQRLVRLFAGILRREEDGQFCLVTPVERYGIEVEDAPFVAVEMSVSGEGEAREICLRTNVDDAIVVGAEHPLRFAAAQTPGEVRPYVLVRDRLEALISRAVFYDLVELATRHVEDGVEKFGVWSGGVFFAMAEASEVEV